MILEDQGSCNPIAHHELEIDSNKNKVKNNKQLPHQVEINCILRVVNQSAVTLIRLMGLFSYELGATVAATLPLLIHIQLSFKEKFPLISLLRLKKKMSLLKIALIQGVSKHLL